MNQDFPMLLVATEFPPNAAGGGPAVIRQMLQDWPPERLYWWSCFADAEKPLGREVAEHRVARIPARLYPQTRLARAKAFVLEEIWSRWSARHLRATIKELQPEVIWGVPHQWSIPALAAALPLSRIGFHVTMQDYADGRSYSARLGSNRARRLAASARSLYASATTRDATSHSMIEDLERATSAQAAQMLHAGLEETDSQALERSRKPKDAVIRIAHAGTIIVDDVFALFANALDNLRQDSKLPIELELYGAHRYQERPWFRPVWMTEHGDLEDEKLSARLRNCAWGFASMALTDDDPQYNRFSFPTKFITYLAAGLPVITLGHSRSSLIKMASNYEVGISINESNISNLPSALGAAFRLHEPRAKFIEGIKHCSRIEFDAPRMRRELHQCFQKCVKVTRRANA